MSNSRFSECFIKAMGDYVTWLMEMMDIRDWRLRLVPEPPDDLECAAEIKCIYGRRGAGIKLSRDFFSFPADDQRHYIVHELCHILTDGMDNVIENGLATVIGMPAWTILVEAWHVQVEYHTDHIAHVIEDLIEGIERGDRLWAEVIAAEVAYEE